MGFRQYFSGVPAFEVANFRSTGMASANVGGGRGEVKTQYAGDADGPMRSARRTAEGALAVESGSPMRGRLASPIAYVPSWWTTLARQCAGYSGHGFCRPAGIWRVRECYFQHPYWWAGLLLARGEGET